MKKEVPEELNWVKARATCSIEKVFSGLYDGVQEDVKEANSLQPTGTQKFRIIPAEDGRAFTVRRGENINQFVSVLLENGTIVIVTAQGQERKFKVGLNDEGGVNLETKEKTSSSGRCESWLSKIYCFDHFLQIGPESTHFA